MVKRQFDRTRYFKKGIRGQTLLALTAVMLILASAGCDAPPETQEPDVVPEAFAEINGHLFLRTDFEDFLELTAEDAESLPEQELVQSFLTQKVLLHAALEEGVVVPEDEVLAAAREWFPLSAEPGEEELNLVRDYMTVQGFIQQECATKTAVGIREMRQYYVKNADEFTVDDQVRVLEILVEDRDAAERIREELEPGNFRLFRQKASVSSIGNTAGSGGELGLFSPGDLPGRFDKVIFDLKLGEISPVIWSEHGFHLFTVEERIPRHDQKFHEVHEEIFSRLVSEKERQAVAELVPRLLEKAKIHIFEEGKKREWSFENDS